MQQLFGGRGWMRGLSCCCGLCSTHLAIGLVCHIAVPQERIKEANPKTIILSGGPNSVHVEGAPRVRSCCVAVTDRMACKRLVGWPAVPQVHVQGPGHAADNAPAARLDNS